MRPRVAGIALALGAMTTMGIGSRAHAQYVEKWTVPATSTDGIHGWVLCDVGWTQPGAARALLYGIRTASGDASFSGLRLIDGVTGGVVWSYERNPGIVADSRSGELGAGLVSSSPSKTGPALIDVDGDGYAEIVFQTGEQGSPSTWTLHCVAYAGSVAIASAEPSTDAALLSPARPNPSSNSTTLDFDLPSSGAAALVIYSVDGRLIRTLLNRPLAAGHHTMVWDGADDRGTPVPTGTYFSLLKTPSGQCSRKSILVR